MADIAGKIVAHLPGMSFPLRVQDTGFAVQEVDWRDDPAHTEAWADAESAQYGGRQSPWWRQNYDREMRRSGQSVWPFLSRDVHLRIIPKSDWNSVAWSLYRGLDHGIRHPECCAWAAVNEQGDLYVYRQYYATDLPIAANAKAIQELTPGDETVMATVADPSIWRRDDQTMEVWADVYTKNGLDLSPADNSAVGYESLTSCFVSALARWSIWRNDLDRLRQALHGPTLSMGDARRLASHPAIWFSPEVAQGARSLYEECVNFRWAEVRGDPAQKAAPQRFVDVDDEGVDVVRYLAQTPVVRRVAKPAPASTDMLLTHIMAHADRRGGQGRLD